MSSIIFFSLLAPGNQIKEQLSLLSFPISSSFLTPFQMQCHSFLSFFLYFFLSHSLSLIILIIFLLFFIFFNLTIFLHHITIYPGLPPSLSLSLSLSLSKHSKHSSPKNFLKKRTKNKFSPYSFIILIRIWLDIAYY